MIQGGDKEARYLKTIIFRSSRNVSRNHPASAWICQDAYKFDFEQIARERDNEM